MLAGDSGDHDTRGRGAGGQLERGADQLGQVAVGDGERGDLSGRDLIPSGLMRLMTPMISRQMRREVTQLDNLKAILERTS